jgi:hypothetical protein
VGGTQGAQCLTVPVANPPLWHIRPGLCRHPKARACCLSCVVDASFFLPSKRQPAGHTGTTGWGTAPHFQSATAHQIVDVVLGSHEVRAHPRKV